MRNPYAKVKIKIRKTRSTKSIKLVVQVLHELYNYTFLL